jgi:hypothetical protein
MAKRLAAVRSGEDEPSPTDVQKALRDVVGRCIFGVDLNPMAVELCKVSLWLEALEPGKPLSFLDHHVQCGNSLIGCTPALLKRGIPDDAFKAIEGDDKAFCKELRKRNREERKGQDNFLGDLFMVAEEAAPYGADLGVRMTEIDAVDDSTIEAIQAKEQTYRQLQDSEEFRNARLACDLWCAAFVWQKVATAELPYPPTEQVLRRVERKPAECPDWMQAEVNRLDDEYRFFHWHLAFPDVFRVPASDEGPENEQTGWSGGFEVVLGNPPWELVAADQGQEAGRRFAGEQHHFKANDYKILNGRRDLYKLFFIRGPLLSRINGHVSFLVPFGIFVEDDSSEARRWLFDGGSVTVLRHFQNHKKKFFPHVHASYRFCQFAYTPLRDLPHHFSSVARLPDEIRSQALFRIGRGSFDAELGETRSAILYPDRKYGTLHRTLLATLLPRSGEGFRVVAEFHSSTDKALVLSERQDDTDWVLLKNRNIHQFEPNFAPPEAFVSRDDVANRLERKELPASRWLDRNPRLVFRDIARNDDERTLIAALVPPGFLSTYDTPMAVPMTDCQVEEAAQLLFFGGAFNSFLFDFLIRPYVDKHIKGYTLNRVPWPTGDATKECFEVSLARRNILELTYTAWDLEPFAKDCGYDGPPFRWDEERRFLLRCELDAAYFHLYGIERDDVDYIMETFPIVKHKDKKAHGSYRTKDTILEMYDQMAQAIATGQPYQTWLKPSPGPPAYATGNFIPMAEWNRNEWPAHIHRPKERTADPVASPQGKHNEEGGR